MRTRLAIAAAIVAVLVVAGCSGPAPQPVVTLPDRVAPTPVDPLEEYADARLRAMSTREKVASLLMLHVAGTSSRGIRNFMATHDVGGLILMGDNMPTSAALTAAATLDGGLPPLIGIDQEGGIVRRVKSDTGASAGQLRAAPVSAATTTFANRAKLLRSLGVSVNFGIVADVTGDTSSFIYPRVLGTSASESSARVAAAVAGEHGTVFSTIKHFPGHGVAPGDSHSSLPATGMRLAQWRADHAPPFEAGIEAGAEFVMFGHLVFTRVDPAPATLSSEWHRILREDLGFDGVVITDDMTMLVNSGVPAYRDPAGNAIAALEAGNTMLLYVGGVDPAALITAITAAVDAGRLDIGIIDAAAHRLLELRRGMSGETGPYVHCFEQCRALVD